MADFLQAMGSPGMATNLSTAMQYLQNTKTLALRKEIADQDFILRKGVADKQTAVFEEDLKIKKRQNQLATEQDAELNKPLLVSGIAQAFYGGEKGQAAQYAEKLARSMGYVEDSDAGGSFIKRKHAKEIQKLLHDPQHATQLGMLAEQDAMKKYNGIKQEFEQESNAKKKQERGAAMGQALNEVQTFRGNNEGLMKYLKEEEAKKVAAMKHKEEMAKIGEGKVSALKTEFDDFKAQAPNFTGTMVDYYKLKNKTSLRERAVGMAQKDNRLLFSGDKGRSLEQLTAEYMDVLKAEDSAKQLTIEQAREYLSKAGGNRKAAEQMAKKDGYSF